MSNFLKVTSGKVISAIVLGTDIGSSAATSVQALFATGSSGSAFRSIVAGDIPTLNQNTSGSAATVSGTNVVTNSNLSQMPTLTIKGNNTGGTANALDLTVAQVNAILPVFSSALNGLAPLSGGGTSNFLRADGTWAAPTGTGTVSSVALTVPSFLSISGSPITTSGTLAVTLSGTALPVANGGTGQTTAVYQAPYANYITNFGFESNSTGYNAYLNTAQASPVNGTGGSPTVTIVRSTSSPLFDTASGLFTHGASNQQGQGFSYDFSIDRAIETSGTPCTISGFYNVASGTYASGDLTIWIYDITNAQVIQPSGSSILNNIGAASFQCEFQPNTNSISYRLIFHVTTTTATAYTMQFDNIAVRPNTYNPGAAVTDWVTDAGFTTNGLGATTSVTFERMRIGPEMVVRGYLKCGTVTPSPAAIILPAGYSIDTSKLPSTTNGTKLGGAIQLQASAGPNSFAGTTLPAIFYDGSTSDRVFMTIQMGSSAFIKDNGSTIFSNTDGIAFNFTLPILGWGTTQVLSSDTDTRIVDFSASLSANQAVTSNTTAIKYNTIRKDSHNAWNSTTGTYTVPVPGDYQLSGVGAATGAAGGVYPFINGSGAGVTYIHPINTSNVGGGICLLPNLKTGDLITIVSDTTTTVVGGNAAGGQANSSINIIRTSGPAQIAASESVNARYFSSVTAISGSLTTIVYATKGFDSHGAYNASTGIYTVPSPGKYQVNAGISTAGTIALNNALDMQIQQSGSSSQISESLVDAAGAVSNLGTTVSDIFTCITGDTLKVQVSSGAVGPSIVASNSKNFFSIARVGN